MYLIILSNTPASSFPENTSANFTVPLNSPLRTPFSQKWRVALLKIIIPNTFYNVETEDSIVVEYKNVSEQSTIFNLKEGVYMSAKRLVKQLNYRNGDNFEFSMQLEPFPSLILTMADKVKRLRISPNLSKILGIEKNIENNKKPVVSEIKEFDPWINHRVLLIHSNLVKTSQVNSKQLCVLQSLVPTNLGNFHGVTSRAYFPPDYLEIQGEFFTSLSFTITDIDNNLVKFRAGNVILILDIINGV